VVREIMQQFKFFATFLIKNFKRKNIFAIIMKRNMEFLKKKMKEEKIYTILVPFPPWNTKTYS
jgi:hypothetical protein